jgi:hypothetical protein
VSLRLSESSDDVDDTRLKAFASTEFNNRVKMTLQFKLQFNFDAVSSLTIFDDIDDVSEDLSYDFK